MSISEEAVEAAAKGIARLNLSSKPWSGISEDVKDTFRDDARAALEAAAPYMLTTITTRAEQVNLPNGTVILTQQCGIFQHFNGYWFEPASSCRHHLDDIALPATVIYRTTP